MNNGALIVLSAPSGCGKTTIVRKVMRKLGSLVFSVSHTTRKPRTGEVDTQHYYFTGKEQFEQMKEASPSGFIEWAEVHGNYYGTSRAEVEKLRETGNDVILDIDVQGARQVIEQTDAVTVFIAPPSLDELERRLRKRGTEEESVLKLRMKNAQDELLQTGMYEYLIVNDNLSEAVESLCSIIIAERCKTRRDRNGNNITMA